MIPPETSEILKLALIEAGKVLIPRFGKAVKAQIKENISSVVTEADLEAEKKILEVLGTASLKANFITEETGFINHGSDYTWVIDPLDGTSNYAAGLPWFGVIIALLHHQNPVLGGMYLPVNGELYLAEEGKGAFLNGTQIRARQTDRLDEQLVAYSFDFSESPGKTESEMNIMNKLSKQVRNIRSTNSPVDFAYVADAKLGAAMNQTTKIWDIVVPWLMIREAGGRVTNIQGNEIIFHVTEEEVNHNYTILASGKNLHKAILDCIK